MRNVWRVGLIGLGLALFVPAAFAQDTILKQIEDAFVRLHDHVRPCVVNIDTTGKTSMSDIGVDQLEDLFKFFGLPQPDGMPKQPRQRLRIGVGSGFIYDKEGHIVTNNHVVQDAETITVRLSDGSEYEADIVGTDPETDLAVVKIDAPEADLPVATLGDSEALRVGQFAVAMGSPRGFEGSLSFGHVSALGRELHLPDPQLRFQNFIQTDAAINLGNSGGPLCNIDGEVIGINIAIVYGANSIGFAIPVNTAKSILPELISEGKVTRGYLGVGIADAQLFAEGLGLPDDKGAFVKQVQPDTPAERAELEPYDVIRKVNGKTVEDAGDLVRLVSAEPPGATVMLEIWRDGEVIERTVELDEWTGMEQAAAAREKEILGLHVQPLTPDLTERLDLGGVAHGVIVVEVETASPAHQAGLARGHVITEVAQKPVTSVQEFFSLVRENAEPGKALLIGFVRGDGESDITIIKVPKDADFE